MLTLTTNKHKIPFTIDDDDDRELVSSKTWCVSFYGYPITTVDDKPVTLHVFLLGKAPKGFEWDHIDRNKLNNSRSNLRLVNRSENNRNKNPQVNNKSGVSGVSFKKDVGKWRARIKLYGKEINLGTYDTIDKAIAARRQGERKFWNATETRHL